MNLLLDTNALLWATLSSVSLSPKAAKAIADESKAIFVSSASAWEIATKVRIGKLRQAEELASTFIETMDRAGYTLIPISADAALRAGRRAGTHRNPFDRMIAAQAIIMDVPVVSADAKLDIFGVQRLW